MLEAEFCVSTCLACLICGSWMLSFFCCCLQLFEDVGVLRLFEIFLGGDGFYTICSFFSRHFQKKFASLSTCPGARFYDPLTPEARFSWEVRTTIGCSSAPFVFGELLYIVLFSFKQWGLAFEGVFCRDETWKVFSRLLNHPLEA